MPIISPLLPADRAAAYAVEQASHRYPCSQETFLSHHGKLYLDLKVLENRGLENSLLPLGGNHREANGLDNNRLENHQLVGFAITHIVADEASLLNIAIHPAVQRRGYGKQLLAYLIEELRVQGIMTLWLEVRVSNFKARALYEQWAFNEVSIRYDYYPTARGREDAIILARTIG